MVTRTGAMKWLLATIVLALSGGRAAAITFNSAGKASCEGEESLAYVREDIGKLPAVHIGLDFEKLDDKYCCSMDLGFNAANGKASWYNSSSIGTGMPGRYWRKATADDHAGIDGAIYVDHLRIVARRYPGRGQTYGNRSIDILLVDNLIHWPECVPPAKVAAWKAAAGPIPPE